MKKLLTPAIALVALAAGSIVLAGDLKSGLEVGEKTDAFFVNDCTGPNTGKSLCYRCQYGPRPVVNIFAREIDGELTALIKQIDKKVGENKNKKMAAFVVHLTDDADASSKTLKDVAKKNKIENTPLTNFEGEAGPPKYKIAKDADITVMMWVKGRVKVNYALKKSELNKKKIKEIVADTSKILK
jgi:hypothetical protein